MCKQLPVEQMFKVIDEWAVDQVDFIYPEKAMLVLMQLHSSGGWRVFFIMICAFIDTRETVKKYTTTYRVPRIRALWVKMIFLCWSKWSSSPKDCQGVDEGDISRSNTADCQGEVATLSTLPDAHAAENAICDFSVRMLPSADMWIVNGTKQCCNQ